MDLDQGWIQHYLQVPQNSEVFGSRISRAPFFECHVLISARPLQHTFDAVSIES